ncbi:MAG: META domain-containing protein [Mesorhizobium sp.]
MKLQQLAALFLTLGVGIAGVMAVEASAERARPVAPPAIASTHFLRVAAEVEQNMGADDELAGSWRIVGAAEERSGGYAPFNRALAADAKLAVSTDGRVTATAGCNRIMTNVSQSGSDWHAGPAAMTRMACPDSAVMAAEQSIAWALSEASTIEIDGRRATLGDATGATLLVMERE